jgi:hypothetical protein
MRNGKFLSILVYGGRQNFDSSHLADVYAAMVVASRDNTVCDTEFAVQAFAFIT